MPRSRRTVRTTRESSAKKSASSKPSAPPQTPKTASNGFSAQPDISDFTLPQLRKLIRLLHKTYPEVACALTHSNPFELLIATILSAQCTDARVNKVTPQLFETYPEPQDLAAAKPRDVEAIIHSLGFFRAKAANLIGMAQALVDHHDGIVPEDLPALCALPGVGRKTAHVVLGVWFKQPLGVVVDTHVKRISRLLGLTTNADPVKIEHDLMKQLPRKEWIDFSHRLIEHGRAICMARRPNCPECPLKNLCRKTGLPA